MNKFACPIAMAKAMSTNYNEILLSIMAMMNSTMNNTEVGSHFALAVVAVAVAAVVADDACS